jgi:hypothetical protein
MDKIVVDTEADARRFRDQWEGKTIILARTRKRHVPIKTAKTI